MAQNNIFGILSNYNITDNLPAILDAIRFTETGGEQYWKKRGWDDPTQATNIHSGSNEVGAFQLNPKWFKDFGFGVQKNITEDQARDYWSSRKIAKDLLQGMKKYRGYDLAQLLAGYNWGAGDGKKGRFKEWLDRGGKFEELPKVTQDYLTKVANKLQEGYIDPFRQQKVAELNANMPSGITDPSQLPKQQQQQEAPVETMLASQGSNAGINQNYDNNKGDVSINFRGDAQEPVWRDQEVNKGFWSYLNPIQSAQAAPSLNTNTGNNNMSLKDQIAHENLAKNDGSATLFTDEDGTTYISTGGYDHGIVFDPSLMPQGWKAPNQPLNLSNAVLDHMNADGSLNIPTSMSAGMQTRENYFNQPEAALTAMNEGGFVNQDINNRMPDHLTRQSKWSPSVGRDASGQLINNPFISSANAAQPPNNNNQSQSSQSQLPPNPNMTRTNTALSSPANSMMVSDGEMLMRMAGAGMGSLGKGSTAALGSALDKYGEIKDTNRLTALELAKAQAEAGVDDDTLANIGQIDETMYDMNRALGYLNKYNLTGFFTQYLGTTKDKLFGGKAGNTRQAARKLLEKLRVDDTLLRIAQTKGAISNKEMDLFLSPSPNMGDAEGVWIQWIQDRQQALNRVRNRLSTGQTVSQAQQATSSQVNQFGSGTGGTTKTTPSGVAYTIN